MVGPTEVKIRDEQLDKATVEVVARPLIGLPSVKDKAREQNIRETLEPILLSGLHPRTLIQIVVQTMKDDGCVRLVLSFRVPIANFFLFVSWNQDAADFLTRGLPLLLYK